MLFSSRISLFPSNILEQIGSKGPLGRGLGEGGEGPQTMG